MSTIVQPRCGVKVRARLFFDDGDDDDDDGWIRNANENAYIRLFIHGWRAGDRASRDVEQTLGGMPAERARGRGKGVAREMHLFIRARLHPSFRDGCSDER